MEHPDAPRRSSVMTSFREQTSTDSSAERASASDAQLRSFSRFLGRVLIFLSILCFALSGYLGFTHYWVLTHWTKADGTVLSGELRQGSSGLTARPGSAAVGSSNVYFFHCTISYSVAGGTLHSQLDSPASSYRIDAEVWGAQMSPGRSIDILYKSSNPSRIRLANNPAEVTLIGTIKVAFCFLVTGLLLVLASRPKSARQQLSLSQGRWPKANCQ